MLWRLPISFHAWCNRYRTSSWISVSELKPESPQDIVSLGSILVEVASRALVVWGSSGLYCACSLVAHWFWIYWTLNDLEIQWVVSTISIAICPLLRLKTYPSPLPIAAIKTFLAVDGLESGDFGRWRDWQTYVNTPNVNPKAVSLIFHPG
jgi:hypothetical protein